MPKQQHWMLSMLMQFTIISFLGFCVFLLKTSQTRRKIITEGYLLPTNINCNKWSVWRDSAHKAELTPSDHPPEHFQHNITWYLSNNRLPSSRLYFIYNQDDSHMQFVRLSFTACDAFLYFSEGNSTIVIHSQVQTPVALSTAGWNYELWQLSTIWHSP